MALFEPLELPCGAVLPNRLAKAAMSEHLASRSQDPTARLNTLYETWARGGAGLLITGNVMVDRTHLESVRNVVFDAASDVDKIAAWAESCGVGSTPTWVQLNHPGRQTPRYMVDRPMAPSAMDAVDLLRRAGAFGRSRQMTAEEIARVIGAFADAAEIAAEAGFDGVQIHAAHGYLASQFLSPRINQRDDAWGGDLQGRSRFLCETVRAVRDRVGAGFALGVKLNSADFQKGGLDEDEALAVIDMLADDGVDLVEISGGSYESQAMFDVGSSSKREAYFLAFAERAAKRKTVPLMVTGGFRSRDVMQHAVASGAADVIGMARPFTENPYLALDLQSGALDRVKAPSAVPGVGRYAGLSEAMMSVVQMSRLANGDPPNPRFGRMHALGWALWKEVRGTMRALR